MRSLITGGAGFIGSHLAEALLARGEEVLVIDDLSTGSIDNIFHLKTEPRFEYVIDTIMNEPVLAELVDRADIIYHLAAAVGVKLIVECPVHVIETNIQGTEIVLKCANKKKKRVILASTSEIYGKNADCPFSETSDLVLGQTKKSRWSYACSKAIDEFLALAYFKEKNLPICIIRFFNIVGPRQVGRYGMVIPTLTKQALQGRPMTVYGDGKQTRTFCHVKDAVMAMIELSRRDEALGEVINLGSREEISVEELANRIKKLSDSNSPVVYVPYDEAYEEGFEDMRRRVPDIAKLEKLIGFHPSMDLNGILREIIQAFQQ